MECIQKFIKEKSTGIKIIKIKVLKNEPVMNSAYDSPCGCKANHKDSDDDTPYYEDEKFIVNEEE